MQVLAVLLGLGGACGFYLASPNQRLLSPLPSAATAWLCRAAAVAVAVSAWAWSTAQGWPCAIAATLATVGTGLSLWPFAGACLDARRRRQERQPAGAAR
ncbi:hypothetical protein [Cupriavidus basilensis]|uniref:hypothetical protein n=1 Tax=Cupriavidus basilensis TaxID=68895 RepID=UPI0009E58B61|nr:hypothetical protein [Cupriavidus basilensis]